MDTGKAVYALERAAYWLNKANESERTNPVKSARFLEKSQYWHDRHTKLMGWG